MKELLKLVVSPSPIESAIYIGKNISKSLHEDFREAILITTPQFESHFPFQRKIVIEDGETLKTRSGKERIEDQLLKMRCDRKTTLVAVGGGTLLDVVGYVAATYCRGIPFTSVPTTLLAMSDAAIGGKTGINHEEAKNLFGAFHFPSRIYIDPVFLESLSRTERAWGLAESIKHGLIRDASLFDLIEEHSDPLLNLKDPLFEKMLTASIVVKKQIVEEDPFETKEIRALLNFGHTVGHAIESLSTYKIAHGLAVALGMAVEANLSLLMGRLDEVSHSRMIALLTKLYPLEELKMVKQELLLKKMHHDKKVEKGRIHFIALTAIGKAETQPLKQELLNDALRMC